MHMARKRDPLSVRGICGGYESTYVSDAALRSHIHTVVEGCITPAVLEVCRSRDKLEWLLRMVRQEFEYAVKYADPRAGPNVLERDEYGVYDFLLPKKE